MPEQSFRTWLSVTNAVALSESELIVEAPSDFHVQWIEDKFALMLEDTARRILGRQLHLVFKTGSSTPSSIPPSFRLDPSVVFDQPSSPPVVPPAPPAPSTPL